MEGVSNFFDKKSLLQGKGMMRDLKQGFKKFWSCLLQNDIWHKQIKKQLLLVSH
jgi:hypothetical protein